VRVTSEPACRARTRNTCRTPATRVSRASAPMTATGHDGPSSQYLLASHQVKSARSMAAQIRPKPKALRLSTTSFEDEPRVVSTLAIVIKSSVSANAAWLDDGSGPLARFQ